MTGLLHNLLLAFAWAFLWGGVTVPRLVVGFALGFGLLAAAERGAAAWKGNRAGPTTAGDTTAPAPRTGYATRTLRLIRLAGWFGMELLRANLRVAQDVLTRAHRSVPAVVAIPLEARTDLEITLLANLITLTPGTLSLDVSPDRRTLYVHAMFAPHPEVLRREIREGLERRLLEVMR